MRWPHATGDDRGTQYGVCSPVVHFESRAVHAIFASATAASLDGTNDNRPAQGQIGFDQPFKLCQRFIVEANVIEFLRSDARLLQTKFDRMPWEIMVVFFSSKTLSCAAATI